MEREPSASRSPRRGIAGLLSQAAQDLVSQTSGMAVVIGCLVIFVVAGLGGLTLVGTLGDFGWIAYTMVMGVIAMALGPIFVVGMKVRLRGSPRHRAEVEERLHAERVKFGLNTHAHEDETALARGALRRTPGEGS